MSEYVPTTKFLAIKNWSRYQVKDRKKRDIRLYVKDYSGKDSDAKYCRLTALQRYVWDACIRLRARSGHNLHNDPTWIARATLMLPRDSAHVAHAIHTLVTHGFLIPTNQEVTLSDPEPDPDSDPDSESDSDADAEARAALSEETIDLNEEES